MGAASYTVEVDDDADVADVPLKAFSGLTGTQLVVEYDALSLSLGTKYFWRVIATDALGRTVTSSVASFETVVATIQPVINYPSAGAKVPISGVSFSFSPMTRDAAYRYRVQVDVVPSGGMPDWKNLIIDADDLTVSPYASPVLAEGTTYAWRVITYEPGLLVANPLAGKTIHVTTPITFVTNGGTTVSAIPSNPTGGLTVYTLTPTLHRALLSAREQHHFRHTLPPERRGHLPGDTAGNGTLGAHIHHAATRRRQSLRLAGARLWQHGPLHERMVGRGQLRRDGHARVAVHAGTLLSHWRRDGLRHDRPYVVVRGGHAAGHAVQGLRQGLRHDLMHGGTHRTGAGQQCWIQHVRRGRRVPRSPTPLRLRLRRLCGTFARRSACPGLSPFYPRHVAASWRPRRLLRRQSCRSGRRTGRR